MPGNFDHNIDQSGRTFLIRFSRKPQGAKPKTEGDLLRTGVATFTIPGYAAHQDGVCRRGVICYNKNSGINLLRRTTYIENVDKEGTFENL